MARASAAPKLSELPALPSERIQRFFARRLRHGKDRWAGEPFVLEDWQVKDFIVPVYDSVKPVAGGLLVREVREAMLGVGKKNGKSHLGAGLGAYGLVADGHFKRDPNGWLWVPEYGAEVYNIAGSKDQAKVLFEMAKGFVQRDPFLRSMCRPYRDAIEVPETESVWRVLASDARLAHAPNPSITIIDELWAAKNADMYEAFAAAGGARLQPLVLIITTAGFNRESIAHKLYEAGKRRRRSRRFYFRWYEAPKTSKIDDFRAAKKANPSSWITSGYLRDELARARRTGRENEFRRWHRNEWTEAKEQAIPNEVWLRGKKRPTIRQGSEVVLTIDAAPKHDSTALALIRRDDQGRHHVKVDKMWPDPELGYLDYGDLEERIRTLRRTFELQRVVSDPAHMLRTMLALAEEGIEFEEFPQTPFRMSRACQLFYELLADGKILHGDSPVLREEVASAVKQITDRGWYLSKRKSGVIDGLVAVIMGVYIAEVGPEEDEEPQPTLFV